MKKRAFVFVIFISFSFVQGYQAFINRPWVNAFGESVQSFGNLELYETLPYSYGTNKTSCPRIYQFLLHTRVNVRQELDNGEIIITGGPSYQKDNQLCNTYWTKKEYVTALRPEDVSWLASLENKQKTRILIEPFHDPVTGFDFSAGTHFVLAPDQNSEDSAYVKVYFFHFIKQSVCIMHLAKHLLFVPTEDLRQDFITIFRSWAPNEQGQIPLSWGGASFGYRSLAVDKVILENDRYHNPDETPRIVSGFDTSGAQVVAAHIAGLPLSSYRNTQTMKQYLKPLKENEHVRTGDIIYCQAPQPYTMIIDCQKNILYGARSYGSGWGCGNCAWKISEVFAGISTAQELENAYFAKQTLSFFVKKGSDITIPAANLCILSLPMPEKEVPLA